MKKSDRKAFFINYSSVALLRTVNAAERKAFVNITFRNRAIYQARGKRYHESMWNMRRDQNAVIIVKHTNKLCIVSRNIVSSGACSRNVAEQFVLIFSCVMEIHWSIKIINFSFTPAIITVIKSGCNLWFDLCDAVNGSKLPKQRCFINHFPGMWMAIEKWLSAFYQNAFNAKMRRTFFSACKLICCIINHSVGCFLHLVGCRSSLRSADLILLWQLRFMLYF